MATSARIPLAVCRLQFNRHFTLRQAAEEVIPYLADLGISDVHASPLMAARAGSVHGYDVVDPTRLNPEIGTEKDLDALATALRGRGMGLVLDIVPNHMCAMDAANHWWTDVMENGLCSPYARFFDIDWHPPKQELDNKVLLPFLGDQYGHALENQDIRIRFHEGAFIVEFYDKRLPVDPRSGCLILEPALARLRFALPETHTDRTEFESILTALTHLPPREETDPERIVERLREKEVVKRRLAALYARSQETRAAIDGSLEEINGRRGDPRSFDRLEALMADQAYRLCFWKVAADEINYRRFFDINELAALRVEDPEVFRGAHEYVFSLIQRGLVTGLRIDHVDGLYDPAEYLGTLQSCASDALRKQAAPTDRPLYIVVEKILAGDERLSPDWPIHGTTGYDFLNALNGIFVDGSRAAAFLFSYQHLSDQAADIREALATCKKFVMNVLMSSEVYVLACRLDLISEQHRWSRDFTRGSQRFALREVIAWFPVYRTYIRPDGGLRPDDRRNVARAVQAARKHNPAVDPSLFEFIRQVWMLEHPEGLTDAQREERLKFVLRLQQLTGPVMAKGLEDTLFYRRFPLASLNEVGAEPGQFGVPMERFHALNLERQKNWPHTLVTTSTQDTKRGEDVRARINVLSEIPEDWFAAVERWREMNRPRRSAVEGADVPDAGDEYLFYQTLVGTWPIKSPPPETFAGRIQEYMIKAAREAKIHTSWVNPDAPFEDALRKFVGEVLADASPDGFIADFLRFHDRIRRAGMLNALAQVLLKVAAPGVPDFYQGTELWDFNLVDPDNRRPVDYFLRKRVLADVAREADADPAAFVRKALADPADGAIKMHVMRSSLRFRRSEEELFRTGTYTLLGAVGPQRDHICAFARSLGDRTAIAVAGRFFARLEIPEAWNETRVVLPPFLAQARFREIFTGTAVEARRRGEEWSLELKEVSREMPVALLKRI